MRRSHTAEPTSQSRLLAILAWAALVLCLVAAPATQLTARGEALAAASVVRTSSAELPAVTVTAERDEVVPWALAYDADAETDEVVDGEGAEPHPHPAVDRRAWSPRLPRSHLTVTAPTRTRAEHHPSPTRRGHLALGARGPPRA